MQVDMHYYGTYVIARAAGIKWQDAQTIAYSAQFVDDSTKEDSDRHPDGGMLYGIASAHHNMRAATIDRVDIEEQRRVWVPFHFIPGGDGESFEEKLLCSKDSKIAREMIEHHVQSSQQKPFGMELLGIACHVYMDTFSHYGFSGIGSEYNKIEDNSIELIDLENSDIKDYVESKFQNFLAKYGTEIFGSSFLEGASGALGHGAVATYPDRPYLHWKVKFELNRPNSDRDSDRNNPETFLEGCRCLHQQLLEFARIYYSDIEFRSFDEIEDQIGTILQFEGRKDERIRKWLEAVNNDEIYEKDDDEETPNYDAHMWEDTKYDLSDLEHSEYLIGTPIYRFHQAACYHRYYVLKELLPAHGIAVY